MKERITSRVGRIIAGGVNALLDAVENAAPETVLEQAMREIDEAIEEVRAELATVIANKHLANSRLLQVNQKCEDLAEKIELAVAKERDDLAEAAIAQQLDIEAQIPVLENQISDLSGEEKELEGYIAALQGKKREMREELKLFRESRRAAGASAQQEGKNQQAGSNVGTKVARAESAFERVMDNATGMVKSGVSPDKNTAAALNELEDLARNNRIRERLAQVKSQHGKR